jgi:hypothetical protein
MNLYAQHGYGDGQKVKQGLERNLIDGVIYGAKDIRPATLVEKLGILSTEHPDSELMLDPHFYASLLASQPGVRLGSLVGEPSYPYFEGRRRSDLEQQTQVESDLRSVLTYQASLPLTTIISPNIVIRRSFDSIEASIAKMFIRRAADIWNEVGDNRPLYATVSISNTALNDFTELQIFLQEITELENPPTGFYLLLEKSDTTATTYLTEPDALARWMFLNYSLKINGFEIINGYTDALIPYLTVTGADTFATGWYNTQKNFSLKKFEPTSGFARRPVSRYMSRPLLKSIRTTELDDLRLLFDVMNNLDCDSLYPSDEGSTTDNTGEALQNWEGLRSMADAVEAESTIEALVLCRETLNNAESLYTEINSVGITLRDRSSSDHIQVIREELDAFEGLAEL